MLELDNGKNKTDNLGHYDHSNSLLLIEFAKYRVIGRGKRTKLNLKPIGNGDQGLSVLLVVG